MPWFPEFVSAAALARSLTRTAGLADPVAQYFTALQEGDADALESVWPGEVAVFDPRGGEIRGHRELRRFVKDNRAWLAERHARIETVASTRVGQRAVVELLAHLADGEGREAAWPIAVVAESPDDRTVEFRTYCSQWPVDGRRHLRPAILEPGQTKPDAVVGRYLAALAAGDVDAVVSTFAPDGYLREPIGPHATHRGADELRALFKNWFSSGGIELQQCSVTDDGERCAVEYNCVSWGNREIPPQAGIAIYERGPDGLLAVVRIYDDIEGPADE
jgi:ketosteroid isomerase-like protein